MHVVTTEYVPQDQRAYVVVHQTRGYRDLVAHYWVEYGCRHTREHSGFCIIDPPKWLWMFGGSHVGLGAWVAVFGQWAYGRQNEIEEIWRSAVDDNVLVDHFGWESGWANDCDEE